MLAPSRSRARRYLLQARCLPGRRWRRSITADGHFAEAAMRHCTECTCNRILRQRNSTLASERHHRALPSAMFHRSWNVGPAVRRSGGPAVRRSGGGEAKGSDFYLSGCTMVDFVCRHLPRSRVFSPADSFGCRSHQLVVRRSGEAVRRLPRSARTAQRPSSGPAHQSRGPVRRSGGRVRSGGWRWSGGRRTSSLAFI